MNIHCCWIEDTEDASWMCGSEAELRDNHIPLCLPHYNVYVTSYQAKAAGQVVKALDCDPSDSVYFLRLPNQNIKIGYSGQLYKRMQTLTAQFGGRLELIASTSGGIAKEQRLHHLFRDHRVLYVQGEQFEPAPEILEYAAGLGLDFVGQRVAAQYRDYTYTGKAVPKAEYLAA